MKIWPIITLVGLIYGSTLADPKGVGRESNPHPHRSTLDAEVEADFAPTSVVHRPVTMAFREVFAKLLADQTEWSAPGGRAAAEVTSDNADDGEDPGKKLFWTTNHPATEGVPFTGWFDPTAEPDHPLVSPPACSSCRPDFEIFYYIIDDPVPPKEDENMATTAALHSLQLPFGALKALNNLIIDPGTGKVTVAPCETILVNGVCPMPCKPNDPLCVDDPLPPPVISDPTDPTNPVIPPIIIGGGGAGGVGGVGGAGGAGSVGGVPELSTWLMLAVGFMFLGAIKFTRWVKKDSAIIAPQWSRIGTGFETPHSTTSPGPALLS